MGGTKKLPLKSLQLQNKLGRRCPWCNYHRMRRPNLLVIEIARFFKRKRLPKENTSKQNILIT